ncbi:MAG: isoprenylcysteine carboxylmethyltransferase family protein [Chloroherpetonaceae bacterium]|nr:isoprenylcysteine carboxylmethyltransferase family protein [Chloroherpetonaceae bacterium]
MNRIFRVVSLISLLALMQAALILLPAWIFGIFTMPVVWLIYSSYMIFFFGTIRRSIVHGKLADRKDDEQVHSSSGKAAFMVQIFGLIAVHYTGIYDYSTVLLSGSVSQSVSSSPFFWGGITLMIIATALTYHATITLGKFYDRLAIKNDHRLVQDGIYRILRHPIYTGHILFFLGFCLLTQSFIALLIFALVSVVWYGSRMNIEESMLERKFGEEYRHYLNRTKRLFPFIY